MPTYTFTFTGAGDHFWPVPVGLTVATMKVYGAEGGTGDSGGTPGKGAYVEADVPVIAGHVLTITIGGQGGQGVSDTGIGPGGYPNAGGGQTGWYEAGSGGGWSAVRDGDGILDTDWLIVAGGGGGTSGGPSPGDGGDGGGLVGLPGAGPFPGLGGTQLAGGSEGGVPDPNTYNVSGQLPGSHKFGGRGSGSGEMPRGGGGGGGWFGGGGGGGAVAQHSGGSGGGGGSSLIPAGGTATDGVRSGHGLVIIEWDKEFAWSVGFVGWTE